MRPTAAYIYCVVHAARAPKASHLPAGLREATPVSIGGLGRALWLVSAEVPLDTYGPGPLEAALRNMDWVGGVALAHERVVEHFARQSGVTAIPMKLFTMFSSTDRAIAELRSQQADLRAIAKRIAGCEEWGVRMSPPAPVRGAAPISAAAASGVAFLSAKKQARDSIRSAALARSAAADGTFTTLSAIARDARRRLDVPEGATPPLLDAAFLVPAGRRTRFKAAVKRLAREAAERGSEMTLTGPWPAYNFIQSGTRS